MGNLLSAARHYFLNETPRSPSQYLFCVGPPVIPLPPIDRSRAWHDPGWTELILCRRGFMNRSYVAILSIASVLAVTVNSAVAQDRVQAGTLVCNTSVELGVILGSQEALNCMFTPSLPGRPGLTAAPSPSLGLTSE